MNRPDFYGTAFAIAPGVFLTAAHVVQAASEAGLPVLIFHGGEGAPARSVTIDHFEVFPTVDVALLHCALVDKVTLFTRWRYTRNQPLDDVASFGFPHAITRNDEGTRLDVVFRAYKGHVIVCRGFERLPGRPAVYEVSTPFPLGMSGGPVLWTHENELYLVGLVLGESTVEFAGVANRVGIALPVDQFIHCKSVKHQKMLGEFVSVIGVSQDGGAKY